MKPIIAYLLASALISSCFGDEKTPTLGRAYRVLPEARKIPELVKVRDAALRDRLQSFLERGYVVSRFGDSPEHVGDAAKFTGIALATLPCDRALPLVDALVGSIERSSGQILRFDPPPQSQYGVTSRDAEVGVIFGFLLHSLQCPNSYQRLAEAWRLHYDYVKSHDGHLEPGGEDSLTGGVGYLFNQTSRYFGIHEAPSDGKGKFELSVWANAQAAKATKGPCYPVDLSVLSIVALAKIGNEISEGALTAFCLSTSGMELPHADWLCGRNDGILFLQEFQENKYEYRHSSCPWQDGTANPGVTTPGVDFLLQAYLTQGGIL